MEAETLLKEKQLRATPHRVALLSALLSSHRPVSAEDMHKKISGADLVTIYRNLQSLVAQGLAREVRFKDSTVRYEAAGLHHHHLVCTTCGTVDELPECDIHSLEKEVLKKSDTFASINEHQLEFFGTCTVCAKQ
jgi:Fur family ferric uptake transcriptional regulator